MPTAPLRPCTFPGGCPQLVVKGMCDEHKKTYTQTYEKARGTRQSQGYDADWDRVRLKALKRDDYLCRHCLLETRYVPAQHVDHILPFRGKKDLLRLDLNNLQSLCKPCHSKKTATEDRGRKRW